jgi:hypothetical protein
VAWLYPATSGLTTTEYITGDHCRYLMSTVPWRIVVIHSHETAVLCHAIVPQCHNVKAENIRGVSSKYGCKSIMTYFRESSSLFMGKGRFVRSIGMAWQSVPSCATKRSRGAFEPRISGSDHQNRCSLANKLKSSSSVPSFPRQLVQGVFLLGGNQSPPSIPGCSGDRH